MAEEPAPDDVTGWLLRWSEGDADALERLISLIYEECRRIAARQLRHERQEHTLSPTALVHEFYLRLVDQRRVTWKNRAQFFGVAARLMRRVLVDHARARKAAKRGGGSTLLSLDAGAGAPEEPRTAEILAIDQALTRLGQLDPDQERIVELRFFAGLTTEEIAHALGRSPRTVKREWQLAKAWLFRELKG
jgi:RNA polymerase sigma factor (TIGR02999 family)